MLIKPAYTFLMYRKAIEFDCIISYIHFNSTNSYICTVSKHTIIVKHIYNKNIGISTAAY